MFTILCIHYSLQVCALKQHLPEPPLLLKVRSPFRRTGKSYNTDLQVSTVMDINDINDIKSTICY